MLKELTGAATRTVAAPAQACFALLEAVDRYPDWYPEAIAEIDVLERGADGQPSKVRAKLHLAWGPVVRDFDLALAVEKDRPTMVRLARVKEQPSASTFEATWRVRDGEPAQIGLALRAGLDVPRFLPLGGIGDAVAGGFVDAAAGRLRPAFVLRALNRFQLVAGFDRAMALASSALTALIPLGVLVGVVLPHVEAEGVAQWVIDRYALTGGGAAAVRDALAPTSPTNTDVGLIGALLLVVAILSFARGVQRLFERTWELRPLSVRNTFNDLVWIAGLVAYLVISGVAHREIGSSRVQVGANLLLAPLTAVFVAWSGRVLSAKRIPWRALTPFAIVASLALAAYFAGAALYLPHLFSSYATRYGVIGAVFAMISALFGFMVALVASAALGREVFEELGRIRAGERPPDDEVRREWDALIREARSRWQVLREHVARIRGRQPPAP